MKSHADRRVGVQTEKLQQGSAPPPPHIWCLGGHTVAEGGSVFAPVQHHLWASFLQGQQPLGSILIHTKE